MHDTWSVNVCITAHDDGCVIWEVTSSPSPASVPTYLRVRTLGGLEAALLGLAAAAGSYLEAADGGATGQGRAPGGWLQLELAAVDSEAF